MPKIDCIFNAKRPKFLNSIKTAGVSERDPIKHVRKRVIKTPFLPKIFFKTIACATPQTVARNIKKFPSAFSPKPFLNAGPKIKTKTPIKLIKVPERSFLETLSFKKIIDDPIKIIGPEAIIIGALILGARESPKNKRGI